ncbi:MAG: DUF192 domain-containing protein [bacterium]|nr:DUF192 domain-containing protein [bacterium]
MKGESIKKFFIPILAVTAVLSFMLFSGFTKKDNIVSQGQTQKTISLSIGQAGIKAFIADTGPLRQRGLGGRDVTSGDESMLFIFDSSALHGIWMKDMRFPIDIFWVDETMRVVFIKENVLPSSYPEVFRPISPTKYVLETVAGFAEKNQVKIGDEISF